MLIVTTTVAILGAAWLLAGFAAPLWAWLGGAAAALLWASAAGQLSPALFWTLWATWGACASLLIPALRRMLVAAPAVATVRKILPPISDTEREALEAGTVWFDADLFSGTPDWDRFLSHAAPSLSQEEQEFLDGPTEELCRDLDDWQITRDRGLPPDTWEFIKDRGFLGMIIPKAYGGLGFSAQGHSAVVQKIATRSSSAAVTVTRAVFDASPSRVALTNA